MSRFDESFGLSTRPLISPLGTKGAYGSSVTRRVRSAQATGDRGTPGRRTKFVPLSQFFLGMGAEEEEDTLYGYQKPSSKKSSDDNVRDARNRDDDKHQDRRKGSNPSQAGGDRETQKSLDQQPDQQANEEKSGGPLERFFHNKYQCRYCKERATKAYVWADGRAFFPVCEKHRGKAKHDIESEMEDRVSGVRSLSQESRSAPGQSGRGINGVNRCKYCKMDASKAYVWADGRAYVPVCPKHEKRARHQIEVVNKDSVLEIRDLPSRQSTAESAVSVDVASGANAGMPVRSGASHVSTGGASHGTGAGNIAVAPRPIGPPILRVRRNKKKKRKTKEDRRIWLDSMLSS